MGAVPSLPPEVASSIGEALSNDKAASGTPVLLRVSEVTPERVSWLWAGRLPRGKAVVVDGDPGLGKSTLTLDWAARVTSGTPWPDGTSPEVGSVVICSAEDGLADTIRPRLDAAGADLARVSVLAGAIDVEGETEAISLPDHTHVIRQAVIDTGAMMVVIDPLMAFLGGRVNSYRDQDVRRALRPLVALAEEMGVVVVVVRHLTKAPGGQAIYRGGGSIGIIGAARVGMVVAADPDDDSRRILAVAKSNLAAFPPALAYRLVGDDEHGCARVAWEGATAHTADQLVAIPESQEGRSELDAACQVLRSILDNGPVPAKAVEAEARTAGVSEATLRRAKTRLRIVSSKSGGTFGGDPSWHWELPSAEDAQPPTDEDDERLENRQRHEGLRCAEGDHSAEDAHSLGLSAFSGNGQGDEAAQLVLDAFPGARIVDDGRTR